MKKFGYSTVYFFLIFIVLIALHTIISIYINSKKALSNDDYMCAMLDKHSRIKQLEVPAIIFAGGSNLAFGLNSKKIENEFSTPVVNLGLHAGLGLDFILNELKHNIKKGDVVFLSIEYFLSSNGLYKLKRLTGEYCEEAKEYYSFDLISEIKKNIGETRNQLESVFKGNTNIKQKGIQVYSRAAFNRYGDVIAHLNIKPHKNLNGRGVKVYSLWEGIDELNDFYDYAKIKGASVFYLYPNYPWSEFEKNKEVIGKLSLDLVKHLKIEIINSPEDFLYQDSLFFDTVYHLNKKGRQLRTAKLIEIIKNNTNAKQCINSITSHRSE